MEHLPAEDLRWEAAPRAHFTGRVWLASLGVMPDEAGLTALAVHFEPGARTGWHHHPEGQILYVVAGTGIVADRDGRRIVAGPGDVVRTPPGVVHWHGATPEGPMTHLSLTTGGPTEWTGEPVTDADYRGGEIPPR
ncbi:MAG TPA: cupin domain-containing protein [Actinobacteria bacterium]|nr:cupin domain-containing protein [Actinomycetota bacterium]